MTALNPEVKQEAPLAQEKVDTNLEQQKVEATSSQPQEEIKDAEDPNWRAFREGRKKDRLEKEAAEKKAAENRAEADALRAAMEAAFSKQNTNSADNGNRSVEDYELTEDQRIEKKVQAALSAREAAVEKERQIREQEQLPYLLRQTFPDYDQVVNDDNLAYLEYKHPELVRSLKRLQHDFQKWEDVYHLVKKYVPNINDAKKDAARADANYAKPKSMSSAGNSNPQATSTSHILSEDRKAINWARMQKELKGLK